MDQTKTTGLKTATPSGTSWKEPRTEKRTTDKKFQKVQRNEDVIDLRDKCIALEKNQDAEAKSTCVEELNNFKNMLLENLQPEDGKIESNE